MDVRLPDGTVIRGVPDTMTRAELVQKLQLNGMAVPAEWLGTTPKAPEMTADPTEGMSTTDRTLAGIGKGMTDVVRGIGQAVGAVDRNDIAESRRLDAALMNTRAGKWGNVGGSVAAIAPTMLIPGAATLGGAAVIGTGTGLLAPSASTEETLKNAALGGALGVGGNLLGRGAGALWNVGKGLIQPFTSKGQESIAASTLRQFASDPAKAAQNLRSAQELVPGSIPTMAQAADDVGLAQLERTLVNNPETAGRLAEQYAAQRAARLQALQGVAGTPAAREAAVAARQAAAGPAYQQATATSVLMDPQLSNLLSRPAMQKAMGRAETLAANAGRQPPLVMGPNGPRAVTGQGMQDLKMAVDDMLTDPMAGIGKNEANAIKSLRGELIGAMESANPAFKTARETFAKESVPINTMDVATALMKKLEPALARYGASTKEHAAAYAQALEAAKDTVKKSTGINKPIEEAIDSQAMQILNNIAKDLGRKVKADDMGRAVGSNTAQNLAAQNLLRRTLGPTGLPQSWAESTALQSMLSPVTGLSKLAGSEQRVMGLLSDAAVDPQVASRLLLLAEQQIPNGLLGTTTLRALPVPLQGAGRGLFAPPAQ